MAIKKMLFLLFLAFFLVSCSAENGIFGRTEVRQTREEAENVAIDYIQNHFMYIRYNGNNIQQTEWGMMEGGNFRFVYQFDINSNELPERVEGFEAIVHVIDGQIRDAMVSEISNIQ